MPMDEAAAVGDIFITATGMKDIIVEAPLRADEGRRRRLQHRPLRLRDQHPRPRRRWRSRCARSAPNNEEYTLKDGRRIYLLAKGRLVNLAAAEGHPSEVMDMSFANQFLSLVRLAREGQVDGEEGVHDRPDAGHGDRLA